MTWKSYAAVSGAGLLATYLVSAPPVKETVRTTAERPAPAARQPAPAADIQQEAARLQDRTRNDSDSSYAEPSRNPFRYGGRLTAGPADVPRQEPAAAPAPDMPPPPPPLRLAGVTTHASQSATGSTERSAVIVTLGGALLVREGDTVPPDYQVRRIEDEAVELMAPDGTVRRLALRP